MKNFFLLVFYARHGEKWYAVLVKAPESHFVSASSRYALSPAGALLQNGHGSSNLELLYGLFFSLSPCHAQGGQKVAVLPQFFFRGSLASFPFLYVSRFARCFAYAGIHRIHFFFFFVCVYTLVRFPLEEPLCACVPVSVCVCVCTTSTETCSCSTWFARLPCMLVDPCLLCFSAFALPLATTAKSVALRRTSHRR